MKMHIMKKNMLGFHISCMKINFFYFYFHELFEVALYKYTAIYACVFDLHSSEFEIAKQEAPVAAAKKDCYCLYYT